MTEVRYTNYITLTEDEAWQLMTAMQKLPEAIALASTALDCVSDMFAEMDCPTQTDRAMASLLNLSGRHLLDLSENYEGLLFAIRDRARESALECTRERQKRGEISGQNPGSENNAA